MNTFFLYKYLSIANSEDWTHRRKLLADRQLYFSDPRNFNDPLDCTLADESLAKNRLILFKAFCMSTESRDDALMFSHYGDSHRGFRLTFEVRNDKTISESSPLELGQRVKYVNELPTFDSENIHRMPYLKSKSWAYESEYRVLEVNGQPLTYPADSLIEVAFGYRMSPDFESVIKNWVKLGQHQRKVRFVRARPSQSLIRFDYVKAL